MKKTHWIAGAALAALLAGGAVAKPVPGAEGPRMPESRAELQAKIAERFKQVDANRDGFITSDEAAAARAKMREQRAGQRFAALDKDGNGQLSKDEFTARSQRPDGKERGLRGGHHRGFKMRHGGGMWGGGFFGHADANKDGKISLAEAQAGPLAMFDRLDANKDGKISAEEHKAARDAMRGKWQERRSQKAS